MEEISTVNALATCLFSLEPLGQVNVSEDILVRRTCAPGSRDSGIFYTPAKLDPLIEAVQIR
jgi:hypothetical protein